MEENYAEKICCQYRLGESRYENDEMGTTLPHLKGMDLLKKVTNMNLSFFNGKFLVLNKVRQQLLMFQVLLAKL